MGGINKSTQHINDDLTRQNLLETQHSSLSENSDAATDEVVSHQTNTMAATQTEMKPQTTTNSPLTQKFTTTEDFVKNYSQTHELKRKSLLEKEEQDVINKYKADDIQKEKQNAAENFQEEQTLEKQKKEERQFIQRRLSEYSPSLPKYSSEANVESAHKFPFPDNNHIENINEQHNLQANELSEKKKLQKINYSLYGNDFSKKEIDSMLNDYRFQNIMKSIYDNEGGYVNDFSDPGKKTKYGISSKSYPDEDIENLSKERSYALYYRDYWKRYHADRLPDDIAQPFMDIGVNQGMPTAVINLQKAIGIKPGTIIGDQTINALKNQDNIQILNKFKKLSQERYQNIISKNPKLQKYQKGWTNRLNKISD